MNSVLGLVFTNTFSSNFSMKFYEGAIKITTNPDQCEFWKLSGQLYIRPGVNYYFCKETLVKNYWAESKPDGKKRSLFAIYFTKSSCVDGTLTWTHKFTKKRVILVVNAIVNKWITGENNGR